MDPETSHLISTVFAVKTSLSTGKRDLATVDSRAENYLKYRSCVN
jgi:hypothetical protein